MILQELSALALFFTLRSFDIDLCINNRITRINSFHEESAELPNKLGLICYNVGIFLL